MRWRFSYSERAGPNPWPFQRERKRIPAAPRRYDRPSETMGQHLKSSGRANLLRFPQQQQHDESSSAGSILLLLPRCSCIMDIGPASFCPASSEICR